jgi:ribose transport system substrate-binding protein
MKPSPLSRSLIGLVSLGLLAGAAGCGSSGDSGDSGGSGAKKPADVHVAFVAAASNLNFASEMVAGAKYAGKEFGVDVQTLAPPQVDGPAEVTLFQTAARTATDGLVVATLAPDLFVRPVSQVVKRGVPVLAADNMIPAGSGVTTYVGNDNGAAGALLADAALKQIPAGATGPVVLGVPTPGVPVLNDRAAGMKKEINAKRPGLTVLGPFDSKQNPDESYTAWKNLVRANPKAVAFLDAGDPASFNLPKIKTEDKGSYVVGAFDLDEAGLAAVKAGTSIGVVDPQHWLKGYISTRLLIEKALGKRSDIPQGWWDNGAAMVTKDNVDAIIQRQSSAEARAAGYRALVDEQFATMPGKMRPLSEVG